MEVDQDKRRIRIFISHSGADNKFTDDLANRLISILGTDAVWYDNTNARAGDPILADLSTEISKANYFIVVLSTNSVNSAYVRREIVEALGHRMRGVLSVIPIVIEDCDIPPELIGIKHINFRRDPFDTAFKEVLIAVGYETIVKPINPIEESAYLAHVAFGREEYQKVVVQTELILERVPSYMDFELWYKRGFSQLKVGERFAPSNPSQAQEFYSNALESFDSALKLKPNHVPSMRGKAEVLNNRGEHAEALSILWTARGTVHPDDLLTEQSVLWDYCETLQQLNRWAEMDEPIAAAIKIVPQESPLRQRWLTKRIEMYLHLGKKKEALEEIRVVAGTPMRKHVSAEVWLDRAELALDLENGVIEARDALGAANFLDETNPRIKVISNRLREMEDALRVVPGNYFPERLQKLGYHGEILNKNGRDVDVIKPPVSEVIRRGEFVMGDGNSADAQPHTVLVDEFRIALYPVTVAEYWCAIRAGAVNAPGSDHQIAWSDQLERLDHPVVNVSFDQAARYADWLREMTGRKWRLPTEAEWEKVARGTGQPLRYFYPNTNSLGPNDANTIEFKDPEFKASKYLSQTTPVGHFSHSKSPYGAFDMAGNVWEWTTSFYRPEDKASPRVIRGGSWGYPADFARSAFRMAAPTAYIHGQGGFRLVEDVS